MKRMLLFVALALSTCLPVYAADFAKTYNEVIKPHEGNFQALKADKGNYYKGKLYGSNKGISAAVYEREILAKGWDMRTLTDEQAMFFYKRDMWDAYGLGKIASQGIAEEIADEITNQGPGGCHSLLVKVKKSLAWAERANLPFEDIDSPGAIAWLNEYTKDRPHRLLFYDELKKYRAGFYIRLAEKKPSLRPFLLSWMERAVD